ncbi:MAG: choice-of-anchor D domain-containing protein, partial [Calditrichaeota bacterium]|nr:choice-of-anchor D domain-containing protein [Calditrichota bacterium]
MKLQELLRHLAPVFVMLLISVAALAQPRIRVEPEELDFGNVDPGDIAEMGLIISNEGNENLVVARIAVAGRCFSTDNDGDFSLAGGEMIEINVFFEPEWARWWEGTLIINSNDPDFEEVIVNVLGEGWDDDMWWPPEPKDFGFVEVGERAEEIFVLENHNRVDLLAEISIEGECFSCEWDWEMVVIEPEGELEFLVFFEPEEEREYEGFLIIMTNDPDERELWIELFGTGIERRAPDIFIEPEELGFGVIPMGQSDGILLTISNDGEDILEIEDIVINDEAFRHDWEGEPQFNWEFREGDEFMCILITEAQLEDEMLVEGDVIGIFTPGGICGGFARVEEGIFVNGEPLGIRVYADDPDTEEIEGFRRGDFFSYRIWDSDQHEEYIAEDWGGHNQEPEFGINGFMVTNIRADNIIRRDNSNLDPGEQFSVMVTFTPGELREYECELSVISNDPDQQEYVIALSGTGEGASNVPLDRGWNMISINILPHEEFWARDEGPDILLMTEQLRIDEDNHHVILMKNGDGHFYTPAFEFNSIPFWNLTQAYQVKLDEAVLAIWSGEAIPPDMDIPLEEGWNMIAYLPTYELDASATEFPVLTPIIDHVLIAKNGDGQFMLPAFDFSNMPPWCETQGYQVKVDEDVVLNYPEEQEQILGFMCPHLKENTPPYPTFETRVGEQGELHTGQNMSILITNINCIEANVGDEIVAFGPDGLLVGGGTINSGGQ